MDEGGCWDKPTDPFRAINICLAKPRASLLATYDNYIENKI